MPLRSIIFGGPPGFCPGPVRVARLSPPWAWTLPRMDPRLCVGSGGRACGIECTSIIKVIFCLVNKFLPPQNAARARDSIAIPTLSAPLGKGLSHPRLRLGAFAPLPALGAGPDCPARSPGSSAYPGSQHKIFILRTILREKSGPGLRGKCKKMTMGLRKPFGRQATHKGAPPRAPWSARSKGKAAWAAWAAWGAWVPWAGSRGLRFAFYPLA